ncbi:MAG: PAS domain-containing hybrid sensor histidine kinase/response regulator [Deltaproteobacteria bacterium]|nr:PAS domain-containing hybrid sensor histidine kinase/response regulator [Deltaproteobacteria bacterium]
MNKDLAWEKLKNRFLEVEKNIFTTTSADEKSSRDNLAGFILLLLDTLPDLFWVKDMKDRYVFVNKAICNKLLMCETLDQPLGRTDLFFAQREKEKGFEHIFGQICVNSDNVVKKSKKPERFLEDGLVRGKYLMLDVYKAPVFDSKGRMIATIGCARDVTEEKEIEKNLEQAKKNVAEQEKNILIGQVAGKMAHDFNNILSAVMGLSEIAMMDCRQHEITKYLGSILEQAERGRGLTRNLATFASDKKPDRKYFPVKEKIGQVISIMRKELDGVDLKLEIEPYMPDLFADPDMIENVLLNLVVNSIHAMSKCKKPVLSIRACLKDVNIIIEVEDNGCGIPEGFTKKIFQPSFTLKGGRDINGSYKANIKGTGYGLSTVKKFMDKHNGNITVNCPSGPGTKFILSLPLIRKGLTANKIGNTGKKEVLKRKQILLVEDEEAISRVQSRILTDEPFRHYVDIAYDGQTAMDFINKKGYDLVSLDYMLPGSYNGMDVYHYIREQNTLIPVLVISGNIEFIESINHLIENDCLIAHVSKPCSNIEYVRLINDLLLKAAGYPKKV